LAAAGETATHVLVCASQLTPARASHDGAVSRFGSHAVPAATAAPLQTPATHDNVSAHGAENGSQLAPAAPGTTQNAALEQMRPAGQYVV